MAQEKETAVTMRVRVGDKEIEVTGPPAFVERKISEFLKQPPGLGAAASETKQVRTEPTSTGKGSSPAQVLKAANPVTDNDRVLVAAYFLEKHRNAQNVTAAEIRDLITESRRPAPRNTSDCVNQNIRKGLLMTAGDRDNKMAFVLTSDGEAAVEEMIKAAKA
jgi:hypothetical protein